MRDENRYKLLQLKTNVKKRADSRLVIRTVESDAVGCQLGQWPLAEVWHNAQQNHRRHVLDQYSYILFTIRRRLYMPLILNRA
jgi:hypothetical protein